MGSYLEIAERVLAERRQAEEIPPERETAAPPRSLAVERVAGMPLSGFADAELRLLVYSELLGERVIFASDNARLPPGDGEPVVYRAAELRELLGGSSRGTSNADER